MASGLHRLLRLIEIPQGLIHPVRRAIGQGQHGDWRNLGWIQARAPRRVHAPLRSRPFQICALVSTSPTPRTTPVAAPGRESLRCGISAWPGEAVPFQRTKQLAQAIAPGWGHTACSGPTSHRLLGEPSDCGWPHCSRRGSPDLGRRQRPDGRRRAGGREPRLFLHGAIGEPRPTGGASRRRGRRWNAPPQWDCLRSWPPCSPPWAVASP